MVKKVLILLLVLGLSSLADAGNVSVSGSATIPLGATQTYGIEYSGTPDIISWDIYVTSGDTSKGTLGNVTLISAGRNSEYDAILPITGGWEASASADSGALGTTWMTVDLTASSDVADLGQIVTILTENVLCFDTGWGYTYPTFGSLDVTIIPEPTTIVLLSLGGLLLRRRK